jgi:hypothetical protein
MNTHTTPSPSSWPFPAADHFRRQAATTRPEPEHEEQDDTPDHVEQELVDEQLERDRNASRAVDSKILGRSAPQ